MTTPASTFPKPSARERDRRWAALRGVMDEQDVEGVIVFGSPAERPDVYLAGESVFAGILFLPRDGEPSALTPVAAVPLLRLDDQGRRHEAERWIPDLRVGPPPLLIADRLREAGLTNGRVGVIGYCSGGRQTVCAACHVDVDAAVDCYGAYVTGTPPAEFPLRITNLVDQLPDLRAPLLGLFGNDDQHPSPAHVDDLDERLTALGKDHEFHRFDGAGHAFFAPDRVSFRVAAARDGWELIERFFARHL